MKRIRLFLCGVLAVTSVVLTVVVFGLNFSLTPAQYKGFSLADDSSPLMILLMLSIVSLMCGGSAAKIGWKQSRSGSTLDLFAAAGLFSTALSCILVVAFAADILALSYIYLPR